MVVAATKGPELKRGVSTQRHMKSLIAKVANSGGTGKELGSFGLQSSPDSVVSLGHGPVLLRRSIRIRTTLKSPLGPCIVYLEGPSVASSRLRRLPRLRHVQDVRFGSQRSAISHMSSTTDTASTTTNTDASTQVGASKGDETTDNGDCAVHDTSCSSGEEAGNALKVFKNQLRPRRGAQSNVSSSGNTTK